MRIVAGDFRGRAIEAPDGQGTRPTTDRVREALFSSLYSRRGGFEGAVVLDAFAGSGALALEALSRGAESAVLLERDARAAAACARNVSACGAGDRAKLVRRDVMTSSPLTCASPFDLVFLDPPYAYDPEGVFAMVGEYGQAGALAKECLVVYEHSVESSQDVERAASNAGFELVSSKRYGKTAVSIFK